MKETEVQFLVIVLKALFSVTDVPRDNSHYVEGKSRYVWMVDGDGCPILVDLDAVNYSGEMVDGSDNKYMLFTRRNPSKYDLIVYGDENSVKQSHYIHNAPLRVIVHGWFNNGHSIINKQITKALLHHNNVNVLVLDWGKVAKSLWYWIVCDRVPSVGEYLGNFIVWFMKVTRGRLSDVHLIGHSLGAHVVGVAGTTTGGRVGRITGLDPAGPRWHNNPNKLNATTGIYVETINTDGKKLGIFHPLGHANFYPNGGKHAQPGCWFSTCSHSRAYELFAASVLFNHLIGRQCRNLEEAENNECQGVPFHMGNDIVDKNGFGCYSLSTGKTWPFHETKTTTIVTYSHTAVVIQL